MLNSVFNTFSLLGNFSVRGTMIFMLGMKGVCGLNAARDFAYTFIVTLISWCRILKKEQKSHKTRNPHTNSLPTSSFPW